MNDRDDGGPAFHMTVRDYFAAAALSASVDPRERTTAKCLNEALAMRAYAIADWMLLERAK